MAQRLEKERVQTMRPLPTFIKGLAAQSVSKKKTAAAVDDADKSEDAVMSGEETSD